MKDDNSKAAENAYYHKIITRSLSGLLHVASNIHCNWSEVALENSKKTEPQRNGKPPVLESTQLV